jgi:hypothetical protein
VEVAALRFCYDDITAGHETLESHYQLETTPWKLEGSWYTDTSEFKVRQNLIAHHCQHFRASRGEASIGSTRSST